MLFGRGSVANARHGCLINDGRYSRVPSEGEFHTILFLSAPGPASHPGHPLYGLTQFQWQSIPVTEAPSTIMISVLKQKRSCFAPDTAIVHTTTPKTITENEAIGKHCFLLWTEKAMLFQNGGVIKIDKTEHQTARP